MRAANAQAGEKPCAISEVAHDAILVSAGLVVVNWTTAVNVGAELAEAAAYLSV